MPSTSSYRNDNRFAPLASTDDEIGFSDDQRPFTEVQSRQTLRRVKRARELSSEQQQLQSQQHRSSQSRPHGSQQQQQRPRRGKTLMFGKSDQASSGRNLSAAEQILKRSVFCIDNLNADCSERDIVAFIQDLGGYC
jgi:hypothetical protein